MIDEKDINILAIYGIITTWIAFIFILYGTSLSIYAYLFFGIFFLLIPIILIITMVIVDDILDRNSAK
jgi:hypothetical protein